MCEIYANYESQAQNAWTFIVPYITSARNARAQIKITKIYQEAHFVEFA